MRKKYVSGGYIESAFSLWCITMVSTFRAAWRIKCIMNFIVVDVNVDSELQIIKIDLLQKLLV